MPRGRSLNGFAVAARAFAGRVGARTRNRQGSTGVPDTGVRALSVARVRGRCRQGVLLGAGPVARLRVSAGTSKCARADARHYPADKQQREKKGQEA